MTVCQPWISPNDLVDCDCPDASENLIVEAIQVASDILYALSGRQYPGLCSETVRPCMCGSCGRSNWFPGWGGFDTLPALIGGIWLNVCAHPTEYCDCIGNALRLPRPRVDSVDSVLVNGAVFTDFRLDRPGWLVRTDGLPWPSRQDIWREPTEVGTWQVTYTHGQLPPPGGLFAAKHLTSELVKACTGAACRLPAHAVAVTRRGVTYELEAFKGRTGIPEVDMWLAAVNPESRQRRAKITAPDDPRFVAVDLGS